MRAFPTIKNLTYLFLGLPLGCLYFIFIVAGLSVGFALSFTLIGIPLLILVLFGSRQLLKADALLANVLLNANIKVDQDNKRPTLSTWEEAKHRLTSSYYWGAVLYLIIRFPIGIVSFVIAVVMTSIPLSLMLQPLTYRISSSYYFTWKIDTLFEALICCLLGILLSPLFLKVINKVTSFISSITKAAIENIMYQPYDNIRG